jgi:hypothetical protein
VNRDSDRRVRRCEERGEKPVGGRLISRAKKSENERPSDSCETDDIPPPREKTDQEKVGITSSHIPAPALPQAPLLLMRPGTLLRR